MSGIEKTARRIGNASMGRGYMTKHERELKEAAQEQARKDKIYAGAELPDEELIKRNERRKAAGRRGSRQRNVLTSDEDQLG
jgi:hypothetical protein